MEAVEDVLAECWLLLLVNDAGAASQLLSPGGTQALDLSLGTAVLNNFVQI